MFNVGTEYRVWSLKEGTGHRTGECVRHNGPMLTILVDGIETTFHMAAVAYVEVVDKEAEEARRKANAEKMKAAWS